MATDSKVKTPSWRSAISKSGGLGYHARALVSRRLWADHIASTAQYFSRWQPTERNVVLVGPSAGYSLPASLFEHFDHVVGLEPDPFARKLFSRRFRDVDVVWRDEDVLSPRNGHMSPAGLAELRAKLPGYAFVFCNVLGQLPVLYPEAQDGGLQPLLDGIPDVLSDVSWASYHDRIAGPWPPAIDRIELPGAVDTDELLGLVYRASHGSVLEYSDHGTGKFAPELPRMVWAWQRTPLDFHVIEGVLSALTIVSPTRENSRRLLHRQQT